ncbi:MAG: rhodanese-like domain-containing protein [Hyphomonadaceae bacterium]|nr:rhodanese-like domain-containing protein [Hyphomonadaceae bacterium]
MRALTALALGLVISFGAVASAKEPARPTTAAQIDYRGFSNLTAELTQYRAQRLVDLARFHRLASDPNTLILDARSRDAYERGHIANAVNLPFTDFTAESLAQAIGDPNRRVLIYCNNNFSNNEPPVILKARPLALNIPTFINLYGYGYRNIYELGDVVDFNDPAVRWVRTSAN